MDYLLVADIGGTNARFGLIELNAAKDQKNNKQTFAFSNRINFQCSDYKNISGLLKACCDSFQLKNNFYCCLAIAGVVQGDLGSITQLNWYFSVSELQNSFNMISIKVINDFSALAYAIPLLPSEDFLPIYNSQKCDPTAPIAVIGAGTGFGTAMIIPDNNSWKVLATAGGHASFAPSNPDEWYIKEFLLEHQSHVSIEDILSGRGLVNIHRAIASRKQVSIKPYTSKEICQKGIDNEDAECREIVLKFLSIMGSVAGDIALLLGAGGGVVIGGGITPRLANLIPKSDLLHSYHNKGAMTGYAKDIPIRLVTNTNAALLGAACWFIDNQ